MSLPPAGSLTEIPISDVLLDLILTRQTGVLEIIQGKVRKQLAFSEGHPVAIQSNAMSESLGRMLESAGLMTVEAVTELRNAAREQQRSFETLLVERQILTSEELARLQVKLSQLRLVGLYLWTEGTYRFAAQPVPPGTDLPLPAAVMQIARKRAEGGGLLRSLEPRRRERPRAVAEPPFAVADFGFSAEAVDFYASLDGSREMGELLVFSGLPPEEVAILISCLGLAGMIDDAQLAQARPRASSPAAAPIALAPPPAVLAPPPPAWDPDAATLNQSAPRKPEPVIVAQPVARASESVIVAQPVARASEPVIVAQPVARASEPVIVAQPVARASEPVIVAQPVARAPEPVIVAQPVARAPEPVIVAQPVARSSEPVIVAQPVARSSEPVIVAQPVGARASEPIVGRPVVASAAPVAVEPPERTFSLDNGPSGAEAGRYVIGRDASSPSTSASSSVAGLSIDAMIAQEIGELNDMSVVARKVDQDPVLDFNMATFTAAQRDMANKFKEDFVRMHSQNYFELFGLDRRAKATEIRKSYFELAKQYHTDRLVTLPEAVQKLGTEIFNLIQRAYDTLTDAETRESYVAATYYGRAGEEEAAIEEVQIVLQADQHYKTGIGLLNAGNISAAHVAFSRARETYPKEAEYNACYGYTLFRLSYPGQVEKYEEGEKLILEALRANPKLDRANLFLGRIYLAKDNPEQAAKYFVRALKINPTNLDAGRELQGLKLRREQKDTSLMGSLFGRFKK